ncbi:MAG: protein kinase domain-containing protein [Acidimicrobiales bacterium]
MASRHVDADGVLGGRYRLQRSVASGGMAEVWEARDEILGRRVAVKVLHAHLAADNSFLARFRREAIAAARLAHPNVVATYDTGVDDGVAWIVMELVDGETLRHALSTSGALRPARAVHIATQVADALDYAHRSGVIHRDVKPGNILLTEDDRVKVADFGIAKAAIEAAEDSSGPGLDFTDLTQSGAIVGTAKYLSPEQVNGEPVDGRSDVYALGVVLYEMLCGRVPFTGETDVAVAVQHATATPTSPRHFRAGIPAALEVIVLRAMAKAPDERYPNAAELHAALLSVDLRTAAVPARPANTTVADGEGRGTAIAEPAVRSGPADSTVMGAGKEAPAPADPTAAAGGGDHTPEGGVPTFARTTRSWRLPAIVLVILAVTLSLVAVLFARSDTGRRLLRPDENGAPEARPAQVTSAAAFDPPPGSGSEHDAEAANLTDGNPSTAWSTEQYSSASFGGLKTGVGVTLTLDSPQKLGSLQVTSPSRGWSADVYVTEAPQAGPPPGGWGQPVATRTGIDGSATFDLRAKVGSVVLLWITDLGDGDSVVIDEVRVTS